MADKTASKQDDAGDGTGAKKSGKGKVIALVVCVALAGGAYVVGTKSTAPASGADAPVTTTTVALIDGCTKEPEPGAPETVIDMAEMSINLDAGHYLRVAVSLGLCADVVLESPQSFMSAPAQDIVVSTLSGSKMDELATIEGRDQAKSKLTELISVAYPGVVYEVFFVEFVMQ